MGVKIIDVYEHEGQWEPLAKLLKPKRDKVHVAGAYDNPEFIGQNIDRLAKLYGGYIDLYRIRSETVTFDVQSLLEQWDVLRRAKEAGKIRAIGIACHLEGPMLTRAAGAGGAGLPDAALQFHPRQGGLRPSSCPRPSSAMSG